MNIVLIILGILSISYDATLILLNPGTFWDNVFSFTHIWLALGAYLIFLAVYRLKTKHSFWSIWKCWVKLTVVSLACLAALISVINLAFILTPAVADTREKADHVILLGGGISKDGVLPKSVISRVEKAAEYLNKNPDSICVVTGGTLDWLPYAEALELKRQLAERGVSPDRILVEDQAKDTIQNFQLSCKMLAEHKGMTYAEVLSTPTLIVTSRFHLRRSQRLARRMGFTNIKGIPAACPPIYVLHNYVREICAYVKLNLRILFTGEPQKIQNPL